MKSNKKTGIRTTNIEWTDHTVNFWYGCRKIDAGCKNCYMFRERKRYGQEGTDIRMRNYETIKKELKKWRREWEASGAVPGVGNRIFVSSWTDFFLSDSEISRKNTKVERRMYLDKQRDVAFFDIILDNDWAIWLILTKRPDEALAFMRGTEDWSFAEEEGVLDNIWFGVSVSTQEDADRLIPKLFKLPVKKRFVSLEPMTGAVDLSKWLMSKKDCQLDWVIVGGETGKDARPLHPDWVKTIRDQCKEAGIPFFFKQWGEWFPCDARRDYALKNDIFLWRDGDLAQVTGNGQFPADSSECYLMKKVGKKMAGRMLEGREYLQIPNFK